MATQPSIEEMIKAIVQREMELRLRPLEAKIKALEGTMSGEESLQPNELILTELAKRGGLVSREEWQSLGREMGYDPRGLGGFFTGRRPSVRWTSGGLVEITADGRTWVDRAMLRKALTQGKMAPPPLRPLRQWAGRPLSEYVQEDRR